MTKNSKIVIKSKITEDCWYEVGQILTISGEAGWYTNFAGEYKTRFYVKESSGLCVYEDDIIFIIKPRRKPTKSQLEKLWLAYIGLHEDLTFVTLDQYLDEFEDIGFTFVDEFVAELNGEYRLPVHTDEIFDFSNYSYTFGGILETIYENITND